MSEYAMKRLHILMDERLAKAEKTPDGVKASISGAFEDLENEWLGIAR